jgi:hypothetical protein
MKAPAIPLVDAPTDLEAHQELAAAVVHQAMLDLRVASPRVRASAVAFLEGSDGLAGWCSVAGLNPGVVVARARPWLDGAGW